MVRNSDPWKFGDPDLNDHGLPVIHDIVRKLGCIRPLHSMDLLVQPTFPEDEAAMIHLARQLENQQHEDKSNAKVTQNYDTPTHCRIKYASTEFNGFDIKQNCEASFKSTQAIGLPPQDLACSGDSLGSTVPGVDLSTICPPQTQSTSSTVTQYRDNSQTTSRNLQFFLQQAKCPPKSDFLNDGLFNLEYNTPGSDTPSCYQVNVMSGVVDPMICSSFDDETTML